jgi:uncharacterized membrane protein
MESQLAADPERHGWVCYIFGVLYPAWYLSFVRHNRQHPFARFHCMQCLLLFALLLPFVLWGDKLRSNIALFAYAILMVGWLIAMIQAGRGKMFKLPVLGSIAERIASSTKISGE